MKSVIQASTGIFLFVCNMPDYELGEDQDFVESIPSDELGDIVFDEHSGLDVRVFNVKWDGKNWIKL